MCTDIYTYNCTHMLCFKPQQDRRHRNPWPSNPRPENPKTSVGTGSMGAWLNEWLDLNGNTRFRPACNHVS